MRQELVEAPQRRVGMRRRAKDAQQVGGQLGQDLADPLAAGSAQPAVMPAAQLRADRRRIGKAEPGQGPQRFGIVLGAGKDEIAGTGEARRLFEQLRVMALDRIQMCGQIGDETIGTAVAEKDREAGDALPVRRQSMGLCIVDHLQAVLDAAQEAVVLDQPRRCGRIDAVGGGEPAQRLAGRADPQFEASARPRSAAASGQRIRSRGCRRGQS